MVVSGTSFSIDSINSTDSREAVRISKSYNDNDLYTKRLEPLNELIETEDSFLNDLNLIREVYIPKIKESCIWSKKDPNVIIHNLFFNYETLLEGSRRLVEGLKKKRENDKLIKSIGNELLEFSQDLQPFGYYASHAQFSMRFWQLERLNLTPLAKYLLKCESDRRVNKRNLDTFLARPTYRLGQYPLLLKAILKYTPVETEEAQQLLEALSRIEACLSLIDNITDKEEKRLQLRELQDRMFYKNGDISKFGLTEEGREIIYEGNLIKPPFGQNLTLFLLDHALFLCKPRKVKFTNINEYELIQKPIALDQLYIEEYKGGFLGLNIRSYPNTFSIVIVSKDKIEKIALMASCSNEKEVWIEKINQQREKFMAMKQLARFSTIPDKKMLPLKSD